MARQGIDPRNNKTAKIQRDLERELGEKAEKILEFKKKMDDQLERLAMDMKALKKEIAGK